MVIRPFVENAGDEEQVKAGARRERQKERRELSDLFQVLTSREGRRFFWRLLGQCGVLKEPAGRDPYDTYYNIGRASIGRLLIDEMDQADPTAWQKMRMEALKEDEANG